MYAIVDIAGQQFKVDEKQQIFVNRLNHKLGEKVDFDQVLLMEDSGNIAVGEPILKDAKVTVKIIEHIKGDKVTVFKKKRRKGYKVKNGFRPSLTKIEINKINTKSSSTAKKATAKKAAAKKATTKKATAKKATAKKATAKKATAKK